MGTCKIDWGEGPEKLEAGTPNIAGVIGLGEAAKYLMKIGLEEVERHERMLVEETMKGLMEIGDVKIYGPKNPNERVGIVAFNINGLNPHQTALILDQYGIAVRSGFHCAEPIHQIIGAEEGSVRASYYIYNTKSEVEEMLNLIREIVEMKRNGEVR
jgi:cysteine desulfurase/selenocysteine lyase